MLEEKFNNIENLLPRYCEGATTFEENKLIEEWMNLDDENVLTVRRIKQIYLATETFHVLDKIDTEGALKKTKRQLTTNKMMWWRWIQSIAAILSIPLLIYTLLTFQTNGDITPQMITMRTNPGITTELVLPDSTHVYLNSESEIMYPSQFMGDFREITVSGEAFFEVAKNKKKMFVVNLPHDTKLKVYGTTFNIEAYPNEDKIYTTLQEGSVGFEARGSKGELKRAMMTPMHKLIYDSNVQDLLYTPTNCEVETAWKDGKIIFQNTPMPQILKILEKHFNVEFIISNEHFTDDSFTGTFTTQRLERILEFFQISSNIKWKYLKSKNIKDKKQKIEIY